MNTRLTVTLLLRAEVIWFAREVFGSPRRKPKECGSGIKNMVSLSLRFGLQSRGLFCWKTRMHSPKGREPEDWARDAAKPEAQAEGMRFGN